MEGVILGASGLIGSSLMIQLSQDPVFTHTRVLVRKPLPDSPPGVEQQIVNFNDLRDFKEKIGHGDVLFICIGTTMAKMKGDKEAYWKVDHDIAVNAANFAYNHGFRHCCLVSSIGAKAGSGNFYLNLKGTIEKNIQAYPFESLHIFRPSILLGKRKEKRTGESIAKSLAGIFSFLFPSTYKAIEASAVAGAMKEAVKKPRSGVHIYYYKEILRLSSRNRH